MDVMLWVVAGVLAAVFLGAGLMKLTRSQEQLAAVGMRSMGDFAPGTVKVIGALEVLAAIGLILPAALGIAPVLVPLAALGLVVLMICAAVVHARRGEHQMIVTNIVLLALAALVLWGRFGPYSFTA